MPAPRRDAQRRPPDSAAARRDAELQEVGPLDLLRSLRSAAPQPPRLPSSGAGRSSGEARPGPRGRRRPEHLSARAAARSVRSGTSSSAERPPPPGSSSSSSSSTSTAARFPAEPSRCGRASGPRRRARRPGCGPRTNSPGLAPAHSSHRLEEAGGRARESSRALGGSGSLRLGPASGGSHARAGDRVGPRPGAGPWPSDARRARSGCGADTGWDERSGCGGPACRPDSRVGVPGRRSVRCARTLPAAAPLPRLPGGSGLAAAGSPEPRKPRRPDEGDPGARKWS